MKDLVGRTLGHYRVETVIGFGGMGQVFRGKHVYLGRPAAIKVMHEHLANHPTFRARFLLEAKSIAALNNPHIVEIYEFGEQDGLLYLVMELVADGTLSTLLQPDASQRFPSGKQPPQLLMGLDLIRQAAEGLDAAHALGMIHRDIKPDNLLLKRLRSPDQGSEQYQLKISDFGLARLGESSGLTTGGPIGTPAYMSPEQCQSQNLDGRSDLYSLGVVLYEVVTGRLPFQINSFSDAVQKHANAMPPPLLQVRRDLPPVVEQIVVRCLAKRPEERYQTGKQLAEALQGVINPAGLQTRNLPALAPGTPVLHQEHVQGTASTRRRRSPNWFSPILPTITKRQWVLNWFFPVLTVVLAVALVLVIVLPRVVNTSEVTNSPTATPATGLNAFLAQETVGTPYLSDSLAQSNGRWDQSPGRCEFMPGFYYEATSPDSGTTYQPCYEKTNLPFSNFTYEVQMTILRGNGGGIVFRDDGAGHNYLFFVNANGTYQVEVNEGAQVPMANNQSTAIIKDVNNTNTLDAVVIGNTVDLYINEQFVYSFSAQASATGRIGVLAVNVSNLTTVEYKDVKVWRLS